MCFKYSTTKKVVMAEKNFKYKNPIVNFLIYLIYQKLQFYCTPVGLLTQDIHGPNQFDKGI